VTVAPAETQQNGDLVFKENSFVNSCTWGLRRDTQKQRTHRLQ